MGERQTATSMGAGIQGASKQRLRCEPNPDEQMKLKWLRETLIILGILAFVLIFAQTELDLARCDSRP